MDRLFPASEDMASLSQYVVAFVGYGIALGLVAWLVGYVVWFVIEFVR